MQQSDMLLTRKNGRPSSCEPCRLSKLRCDHARPVCGRCARRRQPNSCVYHPAPLTHHRGSYGGSVQSPRKKDPGPPATANRDGGAWRRYRASSRPAPSTENSPRSSVSSVIGKRPPPSTGFLGLTSYWADFEGDGGASSREARSSSVVAESMVSSEDENTSSLNHEQVERGARVLSLLFEDLPFYDGLIKGRGGLMHSFLWLLGEPFASEMSNAMRDLRHSWLASKTARSPADLTALSRKISENSLTPIQKCESTTLLEYVSATIARWESIGLLFNMVGLAVSLLPKGHQDLRYDEQTVVDPETLKGVCADVVETCLDLCNTGVVNDGLCCLLLQQVTLLTQVYGDSDCRPWRKLGDVAATVFALGLHRSQSDESTPFFLAELRRRLVCSAYAMDKQFATLLGRPPLIPWQYCDIESPLDLTWEDAVASPEVRQAALQNLDENGWHTGGVFGDGACGKLDLLFFRVREKILALSLSPRLENLTEKAQDVIIENRQIEDSLPPFMRFSADLANSEVQSERSFELRANSRLEFIHNDFLVYRLLEKRTGSIPRDLFDTARQALSLMLIVVSRQLRRQPTWTHVHAWNLCFIGLPCAGYLSTELVRRSQTNLPQQPWMSDIQFPRAEIIQDLTLFSSYLTSYFDVHEWCYEIAQKGAKAIRQVINRLLSPPDVPPSQPQERTESAAAMTLAPDIGIPMEDGMDFMTWLDTIDWGQEMVWNNT